MGRVRFMAEEGVYNWRWATLIVLLALSLLLSACAAPTQPTNQPADPPPANLQTHAFANLQQAAYHYNRYHELAPDDLLGLWRLAEACTALERVRVDAASCRQAVERQGEGSEDRSPATALWTEWLEQVAIADPEYLADQEFDGGWTFLGYDVDEDRLIRGESVDILLYWTGPVSAIAGSEDDGWYQTGERWVQVLKEVQNMIPDGGFEMGMRAGAPAGFPGDIYLADPSTRQLVSDLWTEQYTTTVALLDNTRVYSNTSFVSTYMPINQNGLYLQAGWIKSVAGNGYLGRRWAGDIVDAVPHYSYVAAAVDTDDWQHYTGITKPLEGADCCQVWLLNYKSVGQVYFDNVLFVEIGLPGK